MDCVLVVAAASWHMPCLQIPFTRIVYIEQTDFLEQDQKDYFGLAPGKSIMLRWGEMAQRDQSCNRGGNTKGSGLQQTGTFPCMLQTWSPTCKLSLRYWA